MKKFFDYLLTLGITQYDLTPYKDDKSGRVTVFIPWKLVATHSDKLNVASLSPLLPNGWQCRDSIRQEDITQSTDVACKLDYVPSIAINRGVDCQKFMEEAMKDSE